MLHRALFKPSLAPLAPMDDNSDTWTIMQPTPPMVAVTHIQIFKSWEVQRILFALLAAVCLSSFMAESTYAKIEIEFPQPHGRIVPVIYSGRDVHHL